MITHDLQILRKPEAIKSFAFSKSTFQIRINDGLIPPPISLGGRSVGFIKHELQAVLYAMAAEKTEQEIKLLVTSLITKRKQLSV